MFLHNLKESNGAKCYSLNSLQIVYAMMLGCTLIYSDFIFVTPFVMRCEKLRTIDWPNSNNSNIKARKEWEIESKREKKSAFVFHTSIETKLRKSAGTWAHLSSPQWSLLQKSITIKRALFLIVNPNKCVCERWSISALVWNEKKRFSNFQHW